MLARFDGERQLLVDVIRILGLLSHFASYKQERVQSIKTENIDAMQEYTKFVQPRATT